MWIEEFFDWIVSAIGGIFDAIPPSAQPYLISILVYILMGFVTFNAKRDSPKPGAKTRNQIIFLGFWFFVFLFWVWRIELLTRFPGWEQLLYILATTVFIAVLCLAFFIKNPWVRRIVPVVIWFLLILFTFVIGPVRGEPDASFTTLVQVLLVAGIFTVSQVMSTRGAKGGEGNEK